MGLFPLFFRHSQIMKVFVRSQESHVPDVCESTTVADVKTQVQALEGVEACQLSFAGALLADEATLESAGVAHLNTLDLTVALLGGKQHGSLTQAGRVKGRTPKV